jgi:hypothetical protein
MLGRFRTRAAFGIVRENTSCFTKTAAAVPPIEKDLQLFGLRLGFPPMPPDVRQIRGYPPGSEAVTQAHECPSPFIVVDLAYDSGVIGTVGVFENVAIPSRELEPVI